MIAVDYIILAIIVISAVMGLVRGLLREAIAVITWFLAIVLGWTFGPSLEPLLGGVLEGSPLRIWAARIIIFVFVLLLGGAISVIVSHYVRVSMFAGMDKFLGFVFGVIRGIVIVGAFTIVVQALRMDERLREKEQRMMEAIGGWKDDPLDELVCGGAARAERVHQLSPAFDEGGLVVGLDRAQQQ